MRWPAFLGALVVGCTDPLPMTTDASGDAPPPPALLDAFAGKRILWVGAHPDDETTVAPLLGAACLDRGAHCSFLVATQGEAGSCALASCTPDLGSFRASEMRAAAALYGGELVQWNLGDSTGTTPDAVAANWARARGGNEALIAEVRDAITAARPDVVVTFDPRHGTTCHADHRAIAALTLLALRELGAAAPPAWLAEVRFHIASDERSIGFVAAVPGDAATQSFDAEQTQIHATGENAWRFMLTAMGTHASQFPAPKLAAFEAAPSTERSIVLLPLAEAMENDARYALCP